MSQRAKIGLAVLAAFVVVLLWSRQKYEPLTYYSSRSYVERTNDMIRRGALAYNARADRIELTGTATEAEKKWVDASYLRSDLELFNRNRELFGHFFVVTDGQLREINPYLRTIRLPFAKTTAWLGNIEYSGPGSTATLLSANGRTVAITRTAPGALPGDVRTVAGQTGNVAGNVVHLDFAGGGQTPALEIHSVEGTAVLEQRVKRGQPADVRLLGNALGEGRIARLQSGDWLHLSSSSPAPASETFLFTDELRYARLSSVRTRNARQERVFTETDPLLQWVGGDAGDEMLTFGEALARSVTNAIQEVNPARAKKLAKELNVQLSIDRELQQALDANLATYARRLTNDVGGGDPFAASVTVMNGRTGELVAAASYPGRTELDSMNGVSEEEQRRLLVNHNFKRHPIGSAGKPFFYAAIGTRHPFLLDLTVEPHAPQLRPDGGEGEREVLQFFTGRDYKLWPHADARMDMQSAIERSCNKFTVELATLALAAPPDLHDRTLAQPLENVFRRQPGVVWPRPAVDGPQIAGQPIDFPIDLGVYMKGDGKPVSPRDDTSAAVTPGTLDRIDEAPFIETFGEITGVRTYGGGAAPFLPKNAADDRGPMVTLNYDLRPWAPLLQKLAEGEDEKTAWKVRAALQSVSPERVNLSLNQVTDFRTEFISLLLGGSTSLWTNVQLAEALSRLVSKRRVEATMMRVEDPPRAFAELGVSAEARETVLRGMQRVVLGPNGTAKAMASRVTELEQRFPGYRVAVFSKTGSPTVVRPESKPAGEIVGQLVRRGYLFFDNGRLAVSTDRTKGAVAYASRGERGRDAFVATLTRAARIAARQTGAAAGPRTIARIVGYTDRFARYRGQLVFTGPATVRLSENALSPFHVVAGQLVLNRDHPIFDPTGQADSSAVYMFCIAKWRGTGDIPTPEELQQPDSRVLTVVLYLDIGPGSAVAVEAARQLVPALVPALE
jgi:cell division protein FtsI/penicillin-binding protein 2